MEKISISFNLNGEDVTVETYPNKRLVDLLRNDLGMTSVKEGCSEGECGACTVILDNKAVTSCTVLAPQVAGKSVTTIEGLSVDGELDKLQETFMEKGAVQCGYCTPGMILSAKALFNNNPNPTKDEIKTAMEGNLCRCTGYTKIVEAVEAAVK